MDHNLEHGMILSLEHMDVRPYISGLCTSLIRQLQLERPAIYKILYFKDVLGVWGFSHCKEANFAFKHDFMTWPHLIHGIDSIGFPSISKPRKAWQSSISQFNEVVGNYNYIGYTTQA